MRSLKPALAGALGLVAIAACGLPPTAREGGLAHVSGPADPARRYEVLTANPVCTPTPNGTPTPAGDCDAFAGRGGSVLFSVVDNGLSDVGQAQFQHDLFTYVVVNPSVEQDTDMFDDPIVRISGLFSPVYTGPPEDPEPTTDPITLTITVNLNASTYTTDAEESQFDESGSLLILIGAPDTCTPIPTSQLFPPG